MAARPAGVARVDRDADDERGRAVVVAKAYEVRPWAPAAELRVRLDCLLIWLDVVRESRRRGQLVAEEAPVTESRLPARLRPDVAQRKGNTVVAERPRVDDVDVGPVVAVAADRGDLDGDRFAVEVDLLGQHGLCHVGQRGPE